MASTLNPEDIKRVKALGFLNHKGTDNFNGRVITANGRISAEQMIRIGEAAEKFGDGHVMFTTRLTAEVSGIPYDKIEDFRAYLADANLVTGGTGPKVRPVVACKGTTCQYGLLDSYAISEEIHERFYIGYHDVTLPHKFKIAVGGCPNNCVKPDLNDLGIIGQLIPDYDEDKCNGCRKCQVEKICPVGAAKLEDVLEIDEDKCMNCGRCVYNKACPFGAVDGGTYGFKVVIGGRWGKNAAQGRALSKVFTDKEEVMQVVEKAILLFREQGRTGERFAQTIERIGFENVEKQLLSNDLLERKEKILDAKLHI